MKKLISVILACIMLLSLFGANAATTVTVDAVGKLESDSNLILGENPVAYAIADNSCAPDNVTNGVKSPSNGYWYQVTANGGENYLFVDLGEPKRIRSSEITEYRRNGSQIKSANIRYRTEALPDEYVGIEQGTYQGKDGEQHTVYTSTMPMEYINETNWPIAATVGGENAVVDSTNENTATLTVEFPSITARYVLLQITEAETGVANIREWKVWGSGAVTYLSSINDNVTVDNDTQTISFSADQTVTLNDITVLDALQNGDESVELRLMNGQEEAVDDILTDGMTLQVLVNGEVTGSYTIQTLAPKEPGTGNLDGDINLALGKNAVLKTVGPDAGGRNNHGSRTGIYLTDGETAPDETDGNKSTYVEEGGYIFVDFGETKRIRSIVLTEKNNGGEDDRNRLKSFNIRYRTEALDTEYDAYLDPNVKNNTGQTYTSDMPVDYITNETWPLATVVTNNEAYHLSETSGVTTVDTFPWITARYVMVQITDIWNKPVDGVPGTDPSLDLYELEIWGDNAVTLLSSEDNNVTIDNGKQVITVPEDIEIAAAEFLSSITIIDGLQGAGETPKVKLVNDSGEVTEGNLSDGMALQVLVNGVVTGNYQIHVPQEGEIDATGNLEGDTNLATGIEPTVNFVYNTNYAASNLTDSNEETRYVAKNTSDDPNFIYVDLGTEKRIRSSVVKEMRMSTGNRLKSFNIRYSNTAPAADMTAEDITEETWPIALTVTNDDVYLNSTTNGVTTLDDFYWFTARYVMLQITEVANATDGTLHLQEWEIYGGDAVTLLSSENETITVDNETKTISVPTDTPTAAADFLDAFTIIDGLQSSDELVTLKLLRNGMEVTQGDVTNGMQLQVLADGIVTGNYTILGPQGEEEGPSGPGKLGTDTNLAQGQNAVLKTGGRRNNNGSRTGLYLTDGVTEPSDVNQRTYVEVNGYMYIDLGEAKRIRQMDIYEHNNGSDTDKNRLKKFEVWYRTDELPAEYAAKLDSNVSKNETYTSDMPVDYITNETWSLATVVENDENYKNSTETGVTQVNVPWFTARYVMVKITEIWDKSTGGTLDCSLDLYEWEIWGNDAVPVLSTTNTNVTIDNDNQTITLAEGAEVAAADFLSSITIIDGLQGAGETPTVKLMNGSEEITSGNLADGMQLQVLAGSTVTGTYTIQASGSEEPDPDPSDPYTGKVAGDVNLALGRKPALKKNPNGRYDYSSSGSRLPAHLTDGVQDDADLGSQSSTYVEAGGYIFLDLGEAKRIHSITLYEHNNGGGSPNYDRNRLKSFNIRYLTEEQAAQMEPLYTLEEAERGDYISNMPLEIKEQWTLAATVTNDDAYHTSTETGVTEVDDFQWFTARYVLLEITEAWQKNTTDYSLDLYEWEIWGSDAQTILSTERQGTTIDNEAKTIAVLADGSVDAAAFLADITIVDGLQNPGETPALKLFNGETEVTSGSLADGMTLQVLAGERVTGTYTVHMQDINKDVSLVSDMYQIDMQTNTVYVNTSSYVTLERFRQYVTAPYGTYKVMNGDQEVIDTATAIATGMTVVVTSRDESTSATYQIVVQVSSTDTSLGSDEYTVDVDAKTITVMDFEAPDVETFLSKLTPAQGAIVTMYESNGSTAVTSGSVASGMIVRVLAEDRETSADYIVNFIQLVNMANGLPDSSYTASSQIDGRDPRNLFQDEVSGSGWSPAQPESNLGWAKVDLGEVKDIDIFRVVENAELRLAEYEILYSDVDYEDLGQWNSIEEKGPNDPGINVESIHYLETPIQARYLILNLTEYDGGKPRVLEFKPYYSGAAGVFSDAYNVDLEEGIISNVPTTHAVNVETVRGNLRVGEGATMRILNPDGTECTTGALLDGSLVEVRSYAGRYTKTYRIQLGVQPEAEGVSVSWNGNMLTGHYTYDNPDVTEGTSEFYWLASFSPDGEYQKIDGAAGMTYTVQATDVGKYIKFAVVPKDANGVAGEQTESENCYAVGNLSYDAAAGSDAAAVNDGNYQTVWNAGAADQAEVVLRFDSPVTINEIRAALYGEENVESVSYAVSENGTTWRTVAEQDGNWMVGDSDILKIACVGDSITQGVGVDDRDTQSYPAQLQALLGDGYEVRNFGVSGYCMLKTSDRPYWDHENFEAVKAYQPDIVLIMLGTNDAKTANWADQSMTGETFVQTYMEMVEEFQNLSSNPVVYAMTPPCANAGNFNIVADVIDEIIDPAIEQMGTDNNVPVIDINAATQGMAANFPDNIHPNAEGAAAIASAVSTRVLADFPMADGEDSALSETPVRAVKATLTRVDGETGDMGISELETYNRTSGQDALIAAAQALTFDFDPTDVKQDITLPLTADGRITISWKSANTEAVEIQNGDTGVVTRPNYEDGDSKVALIAAFSLGSEQLTWQYEITVSKLLPDAEAVEADVAWLKTYMNEILGNPLTQNITLPVIGPEGSQITWASNNPSVLTAEGVVTRPSSGGDATAALTATVSMEGEDQQARFLATVSSTGSGSSGGGSGSGGGGRGSSSSSSDPSFVVDNGGQTDTPQQEEPAWQETYFTDLDQATWAKDAVYNLLYEGVLSPAQQFEPGRAVTREEFVKMVVLAFDYYEEDAQTDMRDTSPDLWHYSYIASAIEHGIINGITAKQFGVGQEITRQDMALILYRVLQDKGMELEQGDASGFADGYEIAPYAREAVTALQGASLINGVGDNRFAPEDSATRAEAAKIIYEAMTRQNTERSE